MSENTSPTALLENQGTIPEVGLDWRLQIALGQVDMEKEQMADYLGVHRSTVSRWVNGHGRPRDAFIRQWALRCGVPYLWLRNGDVDLRNGGPTTDGQVIDASGWFIGTADRADEGEDLATAC